MFIAEMDVKRLVILALLAFLALACYQLGQDSYRSQLAPVVTTPESRVNSNGVISKNYDVKSHDQYRKYLDRSRDLSREDIDKSRDVSREDVDRSRDLSREDVDRSRDLSREDVAKSRGVSREYVDRSRDVYREYVDRSRDLSLEDVGRSRDDATHDTNGDRVNQFRQLHDNCHHRLDDIRDWTPPMVPHALQRVQQEDIKLSEHICKEWLLPPFTDKQKLKNPELRHNSQYNQSSIIDNMLKKRRNGFFIECGAADVEGLSNSLFFERSRNWTGLLVEANPYNFEHLLKTNRHAYMVNSCLSPTTYPMKIPFQLAGLTGGLTDFMEESHKERLEMNHPGSEIVEIQCFPLFSILQAMGISHVDYFSLDIEGAEMDVLKTAF